VVRVFVKANPTPVQVIPLENLIPADDLAIGAPCQLLYLADVIWPARGSSQDAGVLPDGGSSGPRVVVKGADGSGRVTAPMLARFGYRQLNSLQCSPNPGTDWYEAP
jgi:hypothetical protein